MQKSPHTERARFLFQQGRYEQAAAELQQQLTHEPGDFYAHSLLGVTLSHLNQNKAALSEVGEGIRLAPDQPYAHFALALTLGRMERFKQAEAAIIEALRLDPWDADYFALLAQVRLNQTNWRGALEAADSGLAVQADHITCTNVRGRALIKLGRRAEALLTVDSALRQEPDNAHSHANKGWALVESGDPNGALEHFREALRLEPNFEWARQGIVTALKAKNPLYRVILGYFLWMARLPVAWRRGVILGLWVVAQVNRELARAYPALSPYCTVLSILYILFVFATWTADPIFNMFLRFNKFGRYALTERQIVLSNWVAGALAAAIVSFALGAFRSGDGYLVLCLGSLALVVLSATLFRASIALSLRVRSALVATAALLLIVWAVFAGL